jgi:16S rRNA (uracil1498-N3)-methyltransferase
MTIANTYRFFVPPEAVQGDSILLDDAGLAHQLVKVLRLRLGDRALFLDGQGYAYTVVLTELGRTRVSAQVEARAEASGESLLHVTLYVALLRAERFEFVLQKGTELGVSAFVPVEFARSLPADRADERKLARWRRIICEAAEQSCRGRLPLLELPISFDTACIQATNADLALLLWEGEAAPLRTILRQDLATQPRLGRNNPQTIALLSGPEGGITTDELTTAAEHGMILVSLGPRILRAETAPLAAAVALFYELE